MSIWHSRRHTRISAHTHTHCCTHREPSTIRGLEDFVFNLSFCFSISYSLLFTVTFSVFNPKSFDDELQKPLKQCVDARIQHWCQHNRNTFRLVSRADRPLWLLYCGETMLSDISGVSSFYCISYPLTAFCYLSSHQKWVSYRLKSRVQTEGHLYILGKQLDPSSK